MARTLLVAKSVVLDAEGSALLLQRSATHPKVPLKPDLPGGKVEPGESILAAAVRELLEETGLVADPAEGKVLFAVTSWDDGTAIIRLLCRLQVAGVQPKVTVSFEHDATYEWLPLPELIAKHEHKVYREAMEFALAHGLL